VITFNTGSIGAVYRALDCNTAKLITVKFLDVKDVDSDIRKEFLSKLTEEVNRIKELKDKNVIRYLGVWEYDEDKDLIAIPMEFVPGGSISYLLQFFKSFKEPLVKIYINQVVKVLHRLHQRGIVHQDIKNSNLMVDELGVIKVSDFGFIKSLYEEYCPNKILNLGSVIREEPNENSNTSNKEYSLMNDPDNLQSNLLIKPLINSSYYCPPEVHSQIWTSLDQSYDIWSLGWVIYEMLTGQIFMYDYTNPDSITLPKLLSDECLDFISIWLEFDPKKRADTKTLLNHEFLKIEDKTYKQSQETMNFLSLYSLVAMNEQPAKQVNITESVERLSILQRKNKYQARDSVMSSYKFTPELYKALGLDFTGEKKASLKHIHIDIKELKRYSRNSFMLKSLTGVNDAEEVHDSHSSGKMMNEGKFESTKLTNIVKKLQNK
jgi:serine/threonine protein kinase